MYWCLFRFSWDFTGVFRSIKTPGAGVWDWERIKICSFSLLEGVTIEYLSYDGLCTKVKTFLLSNILSNWFTEFWVD